MHRGSIKEQMFATLAMIKSQSLITDENSGVAVHAQRINQRTNVCNTRYNKVAKVFAYNVKPKNIMLCKTLIAYNEQGFAMVGN